MEQSTNNSSSEPKFSSNPALGSAPNVGPGAGTAPDSKSKNPSPGSAAKDANRCTFRYPNGSRCRLSVPDRSAGLCFQHGKLRLEERDLADLSADLLGGKPAEFKTAEQVNQLLSKVVKLLAENRIAPQRAGTLLYACSLLLRSVVIMNSEDDTTIIFDLPRPDRSLPDVDPDPPTHVETVNLS